MGTLTPRLPVPFAAGNVLRTPARTLTEAEFSAIINASWENGPLRNTCAARCSGVPFSAVHA